MKKILYGLLIVIAVIISYGIYNEISFTPLDKKDFELLFQDYHGKVKVSYHKDYIGWSHGDFFEMFIYDLDNAHINPNYPKIETEWEFKTLSDSITTIKWQKCPIDSSTLAMYDFEIEVATTKGIKGNMLKQELRDCCNYYSYIYISSLEKYFLLYNPSKSILYYIRQSGF